MTATRAGRIATFVALAAGAAVLAPFAAENRPRNTTGVPVDFVTDPETLSPYGQNFRQNLKVTFDGQCGGALLTYTTLTGGLWGQYYENGAFTPPINLVPAEGSRTTVIGDRVVTVWINTEDHESEHAREREGDAMIFFTAMDDDSDGPGPDGSNRTLWAVYFNQEDADEPESNYGFGAARRVSVSDGAEENVICHGVVTDGLAGEARWLNFQSRWQQGQATTGIVLFWTQGENLDADAEIEDLNTWYTFFDLGADAETEILPPSTVPVRLAPLSFGASDTGPTADQTRTEARYISYNNVLIVRSASDPAGLGPEPDLWEYGSSLQNNDEVTLQAFSFNLETGAVSAPTLLNSATPIMGDNFESTAMPLRPDGSFLSNGRCVLGSDEGLSRMMVLFVELNNTQTAFGFGNNASNARLTLVELDEATGAKTAGQHLDGEDAAISDQVPSTDVDFRLARNGDYVWVAWMENTNLGATVEKGLFARQYLTHRLAAGGAPAALASRLGPAQLLNVDADGQPVGWFTFREGLGYVIGSQTDADVMHVFFEQSDATFDQVNAARLKADLTSPVAPTSAVLEVVENFKEGDQPGIGRINLERHNFCATDGGYKKSWLAFYIKDTAAPGTTAFRLFAERSNGGSGDTGYGTEQIDTRGVGRQVPAQNLLLQGTDAGEDIDEPDADDDDCDRDHHYEIVHLFWMELQDASDPDSLRDFITRRWHEKPGGPHFGNHFTPKTAPPFKAPFQMDPDVVRTLDSEADVWGIAVDGSQVGLWWTEAGAVWYSGFDHKGKGSHWFKGSADESVPERVDEAGWMVSKLPRTYFLPQGTIPGPQAPTVEEFRGFFTRYSTGRTLPGAMIFWIKEIDFSGYPRLQGRVRDDDD